MELKHHPKSCTCSKAVDDDVENMIAKGLKFGLIQIECIGKLQEDTRWIVACDFRPFVEISNGSIADDFYFVIVYKGTVYGEVIQAHDENAEKDPKKDKKLLMLFCHRDVSWKKVEEYLYTARDVFLRLSQKIDDGEYTLFLCVP